MESILYNPVTIHDKLYRHITSTHNNNNKVAQSNLETGCITTPGRPHAPPQTTALTVHTLHTATPLTPQWLRVPSLVARSRHTQSFNRICQMVLLCKPIQYTITLIQLNHQIKRHQTYHRQNRSIRCGDIAIFRCFKIMAICHLGFVLGIFGPPTEST